MSYVLFAQKTLWLAVLRNGLFWTKEHSYVYIINKFPLVEKWIIPYIHNSHCIFYGVKTGPRWWEMDLLSLLIKWCLALPVIHAKKRSHWLVSRGSSYSPCHAAEIEQLCTPSPCAFFGPAMYRVGAPVFFGYFKLQNMVTNPKFKKQLFGISIFFKYTFYKFLKMFKISKDVLKIYKLFMNVKMFLDFKNIHKF